MSHAGVHLIHFKILKMILGDNYDSNNNKNDNNYMIITHAN